MVWRLVATALLLQSVAGPAAAVCIAADHVGLSSELGHVCCDHEEENLGHEQFFASRDHGCGCVDLDLPRKPIQHHRLAFGGDFDSPRSRAMCLELSVSMPSWRPPEPPARSRHRDLRTIVLLI